MFSAPFWSTCVNWNLFAACACWVLVASPPHSSSGSSWCRNICIATWWASSNTVNTIRFTKQFVSNSDWGLLSMETVTVTIHHLGGGHSPCLSPHSHAAAGMSVLLGCSPSCLLGRCQPAMLLWWRQGKQQRMVWSRGQESPALALSSPQCARRWGREVIDWSAFASDVSAAAGLCSRVPWALSSHALGAAEGLCPSLFHTLAVLAFFFSWRCNVTWQMGFTGTQLCLTGGACPKISALISAVVSCMN